MAFKQKAATERFRFPDRIMRQPEVTAVCGIGPTCQFDLEQTGEFPKRFAISPRATGWLESEVMAWVKQKAAERAIGVCPPGVLPIKPARRKAVRRANADA